VRAALDADTRALLAGCAVLAPTGYVEADAAALLAAPEEIGLRALAEIMKCVGGTQYPPRFEALTGIYRALAAGELARGRTLNGCKLIRTGKRLQALRETSAALAAAPLALKPGGSGVWDGRFRMTLAHAPKRNIAGTEVRALGPQGVAALRALGLEGPAGAPKAAFPALPGLWKGAVLVAAPHFGTVSPSYRLEAIPLASGLFAVP
jgi:tRNA(Ile)-lysidine synthase